MKMPSKIVDISVTLDNDVILDHANMIPKIEYRDNKQNAWMLLDAFPGLKADDLPNQAGWAFEVATLSTHNGTHMDAPYHFHSRSIDGKRMMTTKCRSIGSSALASSWISAISRTAMSSSRRTSMPS